MSATADCHDERAELLAVMGDYFDALLHDASASPEQCAAVEAVTNSAAALPDATPVAAETASSTFAEATLLSGAASAQASAGIAGRPDIPSVTEPETTVAAAEYPATEPGYQLIRLGTLTLGIPTQAITGVVTNAAQWTPPGVASTTLLGNYNNGAVTYTVVDTAALLVPGTKLQASEAGGNALLLAGERWALACDSVGEQITPDPVQVKWRGAQGKRPWLAGTLRDPSCALLDIPELIRLLEAGD